VEKTRKRKWIAAALFIGIVGVVAASFFGGDDIKDGSYMVLDLHGDYPEGQPKSSLSRILEDRTVFVELLDSIAAARGDSRIAGIVLRVGQLGMGWGRTREIRDAIAEFKNSGKRVIGFLDAEIAGSNREYYLVSVADTLYIPPAASPLVTGLSANYLFLGGLWEKFDVAMEVEQVREYKTFGDMVGRRGMTPAHREMANSILDDINHDFLKTIADARGVSTGEMGDIIDAGPASATDFVEAGLADGALFYDEIADTLGGATAVTLIDSSDYVSPSNSSLSFGSRPTVAIIHAVGNIVTGTGGSRGAFGVTVGADTLSKAFRQASKDNNVDAIVFRIDSPGGSALASDQVWRSARLAREKKPVVASLGDVAASGGYYMASAADVIIAEPVTLTGSIGVVMFKPNIAGLLGRLGIGSETLGRGRYSRIMDITKGMDLAEIAVIRTQLDGIYGLFLERVAVGRSMTSEEVDAIGGGRVWTGHQALDRGLVDEMGGLGDALRIAASKAGIVDLDEVDIIYLPEPKGFLAELGLFGATATTGLFDTRLGQTLAKIGARSALESGIYALASGILTIN